MERAGMTVDSRGTVPEPRSIRRVPDPGELRGSALRLAVWTFDAALVVLALSGLVHVLADGLGDSNPALLQLETNLSDIVAPGPWVYGVVVPAFALLRALLSRGPGWQRVVQRATVAAALAFPLWLLVNGPAWITSQDLVQRTRHPRHWQHGTVSGREAADRFRSAFRGPSNRPATGTGLGLRVALVSSWVASDGSDWSVEGLDPDATDVGPPWSSARLRAYRASLRMQEIRDVLDEALARRPSVDELHALSRAETHPPDGWTQLSTGRDGARVDDVTFPNHRVLVWEGDGRTAVVLTDRMANATLTFPDERRSRVFAHARRGLLVRIEDGTGRLSVVHVPTWTFLGGDDPN